LFFISQVFCLFSAIIPITDKNRFLLPLHFSVDPGPDFTWWNDAEDAEIAARIELSEADKLALICEYMDIMKVQVRRCSFRHNLNGSKMLCGEEGRKSMTLSCGDVFVSKDHSSRLLIEIMQQIKKRLKLGRKKKNQLNSVEKEVTVFDLRCSNFVVAARLHCHAHQYMEHMVDNYLCLAKERFEQSKNAPEAITRERARMSRSFSTSSLQVLCINKHCQKSASQSTNFLCNDCFEYQKQLMASFGCSQPGHLRSLRSCFSTTMRDKSDFSSSRDSAIKSKTMPSIAVSFMPSSPENNAKSGSDHATPNQTSSAAFVPFVANSRQSSLSGSKFFVSRNCEEIIHTVAVHYTHAPSEDVTTKVSSIKGANGVTHYYVSQ
uniref:Regulator of G-protein signaling loco n=1 Tax=Thelazia callipaeda TaxID=103827 RepID=A0A0N5CNZ2_THECL